MFVDKNSLYVNGISLGQYLTNVNYTYAKQWGTDTGRNTLSGDFSGTLIGIFPKFELTFRKLNKEEIEYLAPIFDSKYQTLTYYDPIKKTNITINTYAGDWGTNYYGINQSENISISFISIKKRV